MMHVCLRNGITGLVRYLSTLPQEVFMIRKFLALLPSLLLCQLLVFSGLHAGSWKEDHELEVGPFISSIVYDEPGIMKESGMMVGLNASRLWRIADFAGFNFVRLDLLAGAGTMDYSSPYSGTIDNISNTLFEARAILGRSFPYNRSAEVSIYSGFGYRRLYEMAGGMLSSRNAIGYDRESQYLYLPVGLGISSALDREWIIDGSIEFDLFLRGTQKSYLSQIISFDDVVNRQNEGYGFRVSVKIMNDNMVFEPFFRYWYVGKSEYDYMVIDTSSGRKLYQFWEPDNNTTEIGIAFSALF